MRAMPDRPDGHSDLSHVSPRPAMGSSPVGRRVWALTDFFVFVSASCLPRRPSRRLLAPLPQDREERVVRIPRRVVPLRVCHHRRRIPRTLRLPAPHRHNSGYEQPAPLSSPFSQGLPNAGTRKLTTVLSAKLPRPPVRARRTLVCPHAEARRRAPQGRRDLRSAAHRHLRRLELRHVERRPRLARHLHDLLPSHHPPLDRRLHRP